MDAKAKLVVERIVHAITSGAFTERDVLALLIALREHASPGSAMREFGDFVAHRDRDRGLLLAARERVRLALLGQSNATERLPVWDVAQIGHSINNTLNSIGIISLDDEAMNRVVVCVICLLQGVRLGAPGAVNDKLVVAISSYYVMLMAEGAVPAGHIFQFPLLVAENRGYEESLAQHDVPYPLRCDHVMECSASAGEFRIEARASAV